MSFENEIQRITVIGDNSIISCMHLFNEYFLPTLLVTDKNGVFLGTLTDGDIRRAFLQGIRISDPIYQAMQKNAVVGYTNESPRSRFARMKSGKIRHLPILDSTGHLAGLEIEQAFLPVQTASTSAVIMCGGLGTRMGCLTKNCPKPMLPVGGKPMLERILENLMRNGISKFYFAVNYLHEIIEKHFGDGSQWGVEIQYLREQQRLGTGGALSLIPEQPKSPIIVMNGDVLTDVNFRHMLSFHNYNRAFATMGIAEFTFQNPYGVVNYSENKLMGFEEKPVNSWFINSGCYIIEPGLLQFVPKDTFIDMPTLIQQAQHKNKDILVYPICETWMDVGRQGDYAEAQSVQLYGEDNE